MNNKTKILLLFIVILSCLKATAQNTDSLKYFIGYWVTDSSSEKIVIFKDQNNTLQMVSWDSSDGEEIDIEKLDFNNNTLTTTEKTKSTNWLTTNKYFIFNENTLMNTFNNKDGAFIFYFQRAK